MDFTDFEGLSESTITFVKLLLLSKILIGINDLKLNRKDIRVAVSGVIVKLNM